MERASAEPHDAEGCVRPSSCHGRSHTSGALAALMWTLSVPMFILPPKIYFATFLRNTRNFPISYSSAILTSAPHFVQLLTPVDS